MRILSALLDTALLPLAIAKDAMGLSIMDNRHKSYTREKLEEIEDNLER